MFLFFTVMVLIGAFFLLNLTLAVINSKFSEAHNRQHDLDQMELKEKALPPPDDGFKEEQNTANLNDQRSVGQFINARIYAKRMVEFLRIRQDAKKKLMVGTVKYDLLSRL